MAVPEDLPEIFVHKGTRIIYDPEEDLWRFTYHGVTYERDTLLECTRLIDRFIAFPRTLELQEEEERRRLEEEERLRRLEEEPPEVEEPPPEPEPEIEPPEVFEIPALPWYAAWLKPVIEYIGKLTESVVNFFAPVFEPIQDAVDALWSIPSKLIESLIEGIKDIFFESSERGGEVSSKVLTDVAAGSPAWMEDVQTQLNVMTEALISQYNEAVSVGTYEKSPLTGEDAVLALEDLKSKLLTAAIANFAVHALVESGSLGQLEFMRDLDSIVVSKFGMNALIERATMLPLEKSILIPAEYEFNRRFPTTIPTAQELINMVVKEVITLDRFKEEMLKLGFREEYSQFIWDAHFKPPDWTMILNAFYRGELTREELEGLKILVDLDPRYNKIWDAMIEVIPPYQELVNERVKEVLTQEEFEQYLQWHGFDKKWADRIWLASKIPPALGDILTAWRRGLISESRVDELMILVDLDPRFKEIFDTRKYIDPSVTVARYMFETGAINEARVREIVARQGYLPEDIDSITNFIVRFQERIYRRRYLTALQTGITARAFTEDELREAVREAGLTEEVAEWMIKTAEVRTRIVETRARPTAPKLLSLGDLKKAYVWDKISEDEFRRDLLFRNYEVGEVDLLIQIMNEDKVTKEAGGRKIALSESQLMNAWRYDELTEDALRIELALRGLATDEIDILINTKKKQWEL